MHVSKRHNGIALAIFAFCLTALVMLALTSTTWAAPGAQGTVPTAPAPTQPAATPGGGGDNGGGNNTGGNSSGGDAGNAQATTVPSVPGPGTVCAIGENGAQCASGDMIVVVGAGAVGAGSALTIEGSFGQPPCPASPVGINFLNRCYRFTWIDTNAQPLKQVNGPIQYCIAYGPEQLAATTNNPSAFLIGLAGANGQWSLVKPNLDAAGGRVCATSDQLIKWSALFAPQSSSVLLPTTGAAFQLWWLAPIALFGAALWFGALRLRVRAR